MTTQVNLNNIIKDVVEHEIENGNLSNIIPSINYFKNIIDEFNDKIHILQRVINEKTKYINADLSNINLDEIISALFSSNEIIDATTITNEEIQDIVYSLSQDISFELPDCEDLLLSCEYILSSINSNTTRSFNLLSNNSRVPLYNLCYSKKFIDLVPNNIKIEIRNGIYGNIFEDVTSFVSPLNDYMYSSRFAELPHYGPYGTRETGATKKDFDSYYLEEITQWKNCINNIKAKLEQTEKNTKPCEDWGYYYGHNDDHPTCKQMWKLLESFRSEFCDDRFNDSYTMYYDPIINRHRIEVSSHQIINLINTYNILVIANTKKADKGKEPDLKKSFKLFKRIQKEIYLLVVPKIVHHYKKLYIHDEIEPLLKELKEFHNENCHKGGGTCSKDSEWYGNEAQAPLSADLYHCHEKNAELVKDLSTDDIPEGFKLENGLIKYKTITRTSYYCARSEEEGCLAEGEHKEGGIWEDVFLGDRESIGDHVICPYHDGLSFDIPEGYIYDESSDAFVKHGEICKLTDTASFKEHGFDGHGEPIYFPVDVNFYE